uniref:Uncharacterized protein n=1 Tax=Anopheles dirus TaxID=7168 RepID=A0A182NWT7_9DIPT
MLLLIRLTYIKRFHFLFQLPQAEKLFGVFTCFHILIVFICKTKRAAKSVELEHDPGNLIYAVRFVMC